jgi:MFS family permease
VTTLRSLKMLSAAQLVTDIADRAGQVAIPIVAMGATGSAVSAGWVSAGIAVPIVASPWWARPARRLLRSGRSLAVATLLYAAATLGFALVLCTPGVGIRDLVSLAALLGAAQALVVPARQALLADIGDAHGPGTAAAALTWTEAGGRIAVVIGPPLGAIGIHALGPPWVFTMQSGCLVVASALTSIVRHRAHPGPPAQVRGLRGLNRQIAMGLWMRTTSSFVWCAFSLGMAVQGQASGHPGVIFACGSVAYGAGSVIIAIVFARRRPRNLLRTAAYGWTIVGLAWITAGSSSTLAGFTIAGLVAGLGSASGFACVNALIAARLKGVQRQEVFGLQTMLMNAAGAIGNLIGGTIIAHMGVGIALFLGGGTLTLVAAGTASITHGKRPTNSATLCCARRPCTSDSSSLPRSDMRT